MPDVNSRCMSTEYCVGVIQGKFYSISSEGLDYPDVNPSLTDLELVEIVLTKMNEKGINKELGFEPYKSQLPDRQWLVTVAYNIDPLNPAFKNGYTEFYREID